MPSFRARVLDALDIKKDHVRIPTFCTFPVPKIGDAQEKTADPENLTKVDDTGDWAISQTLKVSELGPTDRKDKLDILGFVVGEDPGTTNTTSGGTTVIGVNPLPNCIDRLGDSTNETAFKNQDYTGFHYLGGLYDATNEKLASMRKSSMVPKAHQSLMWYPTTSEQGDNDNDPADMVDHTHKDWPSDRVEQAQLLQDDPYADSLYYHSTKIRFFLTGLDDVATAAGSGDAAANHRGSVRMLVLRPKIPKVTMRVNGTNSSFIINHDFLPNWDTELFYDRRHQIGGRIHQAFLPHGHGVTGEGNQNAEAITAYGLEYINDIRDLNVDTVVSSPTYGHSKPTRMKAVTTAGAWSTSDAKNGLTPFDLLTSRINTNKYAVLEDKVFTLDSLHHGAAAHHVCNVTIPYNKKVRFQGRQPNGSSDELSDDTFNEPLNLQSRPIILFLSYNQRISAQVTGYTTISET